MHPEVASHAMANGGDMPASELIAGASFGGIPLRPKRGYTFANFRTNHQVARARCVVMRYTSGARPYGLHTLAIVGSSGTGKTHLLNAAGHAAIVNGQFGSAVTLSSSRLYQLVEDGLRFDDWWVWRHRLVQAEWLAIDDIDQVGQSPIVASVVLDVLRERSIGLGRTLLSLSQQSIVQSSSTFRDFLLDVSAISLTQDKTK